MGFGPHRELLDLIEGVVAKSFRFGLSPWVSRRVDADERAVFVRVPLFFVAVLGFLTCFRVFGPFGFRQGGEHHVDATADQFRFEVGLAVGSEFGDKFLDDLEAEFLMGHFTSAEAEAGLDLHVFAEESNGVVDLDAEVMGVDTRAELDFLDLVLVFFALFILFGLFVFVAAVFDEAAYGRNGLWGNLHEVDVCSASHTDGFTEGFDP